MQRVYLPNIQSLEINSFSLYSEKSIKLDLRKSVSCLLGANGIGKSTLLNCLNYVITGYINQPVKKILSINDFVDGNTYHLKYFDGRISEMDKEFAYVKVEFILNNKRIIVKRKFFPNNSVTECYIDDIICENYESCIVELSNLKQYNQFVFLQLKVLSFDEARDCLFWNQSVLTPTLFICMGANVDEADRADELSREIQKYMSRIRNLQWEITKQSTRLNTLIEEMAKLSSSYKEEDKASIKNEYEEILNKISDANNEYNDCISERKSLNARIAELSIKKLELDNEYNRIYQLLFEDRGTIEKHPLIQKLREESCPICGTRHASLPVKVSEAITKCECPLCGSKVSNKSENDANLFTKLNSLDKNVHEAVSMIEESDKRSRLISDRIDELHNLIVILTSRKSELEQNNYSSLNIDYTDVKLGERISSLKSAINEVENDKVSAIHVKDDLKSKYDALCISLQRIYQDTQLEFIPIFKNLAYSFTGLNIDISLNTNSDDGRTMFKFILQIGDSNRNNEFELSESQRFFIDIALRMAIITYVCSEDKNCTMLIDTPEGSLDIAYETNAGKMFSEYINSDHKLIITANLNSSGLIKTLASSTGREKFNLISMLKWANLSSVQSSHIDLFSTAITEIDDLLR